MQVNVLMAWAPAPKCVCTALLQSISFSKDQWGREGGRRLSSGAERGHARQHHCWARGPFFNKSLTVNQPLGSLTLPSFLAPCLFFFFVFFFSSFVFAAVLPRRWPVRGSRKGKPWNHWGRRARVWRRSWRRRGASSTTWSVSGYIPKNKTPKQTP